MADRLEAIPADRLGSSAALTRRLLAGELARQRALVRDGWLERDVNGTSSGAHALVEIVASFDRASLRDWRWTLTRLGEARAWAESYVALLERGLAAGRVAPRAAVTSTIASLDAMRAFARPKNPFAVLARELASSRVREPERSALGVTLANVVDREVGPALERVRTFLATRYLPRAPTSLDAASYRFHVESHLGEDAPSAEALHAWGAREVDTLRRALRRAVVKAFGSSASLPRTMARLHARERFASEDELLRAATIEVGRARTIVRRAVPVPRGAVKIERVPPHQAGTMLAQYLTPRGGDGTLQLNTTTLLGAQRRHELATLVTHETFGGHHLAALHAEAQPLPDFRRHAAVTAFDEGWALYAEQLRDEQGGFTPVERVGYLAQQLWRAARLVVDTGLHRGTMSRRDAIRYLEKRAFLPRARAAAEVRRYLDCPAQALAYYVGKARILAIRKEVRRILGAAFDLRRFHEKLLSLGAIPLGEAERAMIEWAKRRSSQLGTT